jgi:succinyl-diaminopimelate desuccinylase
LIDAVNLTRELIRRPSVTPADAGAMDVVEQTLKGLGFACRRMRFGEIENLYARYGTARPNLCFAGHTDVVPVGDDAAWTAGPFEAEIKDGVLYGRGAVDMKGSIAAMVAAVAQVPVEAGTVSFIITGDEEGPARFGTVALIELMRAKGLIPDLCLVGEPTSVNRLGDMMKVGRRGSVNIWIEVEGVQGHVAYPHLADNPITRLVAILAELDAIVLDEGTDWFQASNLEVTDLSCGNPATNVIPAKASARLSIRFNDLHTGEGLAARVSAIAQAHGGTARAVISGEAFLTQPGSFSAMLADAIRAEIDIEPELSTTGGTSDARFLKDLSPVIEFGLCNATMHKRDEAVAIADLEALVGIYRRVTLAALAG